MGTPALADPSAPSPAPTSTTAKKPKKAEKPADPVLAAIAEARTSREPVTVPTLADEYSTTSANPDGTLTKLTSSTPQRVDQGGKWVPIDTSLVKRTDGSYSPKAALSTLSIAADGSTKLLTIKDGPKELTFSWPEKLPKPSVAGDTATYADVLPDVDLQITADATGYSSIFVVKNAQAAANPDLQKLEFGLTGTGVKLAETRDGGAAATDTGTGEDVFRTGTALMWDSSPGKDGATPAVTAAEAAADPVAAHEASAELGGKQAKIKVEVAGGKQTLSLDKALLTDSDTRYPVYVDPSWGGGSKGSQLNWARISSNGWNVYNSTSKTGSARARIGLDDWPEYGGEGEKAKTYYNMNTSDIRGAEVSEATLYVTHTWSATCASTASVVYATKSPSSWNSSGLYWGHEPTALTGVLSTVKAGKVNCGTKSEKVSPPTLAFNVLSYAKTAITTTKLSSLTFRVEAKDMSDKMSWKQLGYGGGANLSIKYSYRPYLLNGTGNPAATPSLPNAGKTVTTTPTPTLSAQGANQTVSGVSERVRIQYQIYNSTKGTRLYTGTSGFSTTGERWATPKLADGEYYWRATVQNESGLWSNTYTAWQNLVVDTKAPGAPTVNSANYPADQVGDVYGTNGTWVIGPHDYSNNVVGYLFTLDADLANVVYASNKGTPWAVGTAIKPGTVYFAKADNGPGTGTAVMNGWTVPTFAPATAGSHVLQVKAVDQGGSTSVQTTYKFNAGTTKPIYVSGAKMFAGYTEANTDGTTSAVPKATTTSATGSVSQQDSGSAGFYFTSGGQLMLSGMSATNKVLPGDTATVSFNLPKAGVWDIGANLVTSHDYGTYSLVLDKGKDSQTVLIENFDAYGSGRVSTTYRNFGTIKTALGAPRILTQGVHTITLTVLGKNAASAGYQAGIDLVRLGAAITCSLDNTAACLNNTAISTYTAGSTPTITAADADGAGYSFESADFKARGWTPGATVTVNGAKIKMPSAYGNGTVDNMLASGQYITVPSNGSVVNKGNALILVGYSTMGSGGVTGASGTITYTTSSCGTKAQPYSIDNASDWAYVPSSDTALSFTRRNGKGATQAAGNAAVWAVSVPLLCPGAAVESITLPLVSNIAQDGVPSVHFFGLGIRPTSNTGSAKWVGTWAAAQDTAALYDANPPNAASTLTPQTVRFPAVLSIGTGGDTQQVRVRVANSLGKTPVTLSAVTIAPQDTTTGGATAASTPLPLTFGGSPAVTLAAGTDQLSDPVTLSLPQLSTVLVSMKVAGTVTAISGHRDPKVPVYITADSADHTKDIAAGSFKETTIDGIPFVSGIDVTTSATAPAGALALFGDQTVNADTSTPDGKSQLNGELAQIFAANEDTGGKVPFGILNLGSSSWGNQTSLPTSTLALGTNAKGQIDRALLNQSNVRAALLSAGAADLLACTATTADACANAVETKLTSIASQLHQYQADDVTNGSVKLPTKNGSIKVYAATIPPFSVANPPTALQEQARLLVNDYILGSLKGHADGVIDFSEAVSAGIAEGSTATYDTVLSDYLRADGTVLRPAEAYYEALAWQYVTNADKSDWIVDDQSGGTEDGADSNAVWEFTDDGGTTARDTGHGTGTGSNRTLHPATLTDVTWGKSRQVGFSAGTFNGTSSYGTTGLKPNTTTSYTVSAWVKLTDGSADRPVFSRGSVGGQSSLSLIYQASDKKWAAEVPTAASGIATERTTVSSDAEAKIGVWTHLAVSYDAETTTLSLYVNGHQDTSRDSVPPFNDPNGPTYIGRSKDSYFAGDIAGVQVWARPLGEAEMQTWVEPIEVLDWELNWNGAATDAEDGAFYNHPGVLTGGASYVQPGHAKPDVPAGEASDTVAAHFDGVDGAITRDAVLNTDQSFSVSAWVRLAKTDGNYTIVSQDGTHTARFLLQWSRTNNSWRFMMTDSDVAEPATKTADAPAGEVALNTWTHLVGVYDASADTVALYVNGVQKAVSPATSRWNATGTFAVGRTMWQDHKSDYFPGDIDAVHAYQGAIAPDDVAWLYEQ
ncbi:hypothetical protein Acy02nite_90600 [Actinoplanes cyaneus]|uniref:LamG-like jellyroll fold domain-containing protein n=1 Tax=Actinoplanes cyaneus TaxID=52696 RepID=A0A919MCZ4_9ACTN|nr:LamG-like jellyroll fold domain-containing protein [Actinoplanes cyaneus]GID71179.1 hypothetical protein Acy02nite_90600 [Actinoplanes cyaneus]